MDFWNSKKIKATKKSHTCEYCGRIIPIGSSCRNEVGVYEGDFHHYYLCDRCYFFICNFADTSDGYLGEFWGSLFESDLLQCPKCSSFSHRDYEMSEDKQKIDLECDQCDHKWTVDLSLEALEKICAASHCDQNPAL